MQPFRSESLANGVTVEFFDATNRYFGDYHRVCVEVRLTVSLGAAAGKPDSSLQTVKRLERMGVPGNEVIAVRNRLADDFWRHAGAYLAHADYPVRLAATLAREPRRQALVPLRPC
jgi:hypothetical protein